MKNEMLSEEEINIVVKDLLNNEEKTEIDLQEIGDFKITISNKPKIKGRIQFTIYNDGKWMDGRWTDDREQVYKRYEEVYLRVTKYFPKIIRKLATIGVTVK